MQLYEEDRQLTCIQHQQAFLPLFFFFFTTVSFDPIAFVLLAFYDKHDI